MSAKSEFIAFIKTVFADGIEDAHGIFSPKSNVQIDFIDLKNFNEETVGKLHLRRKMEQLDKDGIRYMAVFEDEWKGKQAIVKSRISSVGQKHTDNYFARKLTIKNLTATESSKFFKENHLQGNVGAVHRYGLVTDDGEVVMAMTFGRPRYKSTDTAEWEMRRLASKLGANVVGGASRLFKHFVKEQNPKSIVSYCELRYGRGTVYQKLGFDLKNVATSNFFWYRTEEGVRESRLKFRRHKLKSLGLTGIVAGKTKPQIMYDNGYKRIFDCGNKSFLWKKSA